MTTVLGMTASLLVSCGGSGANTITVYNGQHSQLTEALVHAFEQQTGIDVRVRTDDGIVLADQILQRVHVAGRRVPDRKLAGIW